MTNIVLSMQNQLLLEAIGGKLRETGNFRTTSLPAGRIENSAKDSIPLRPDIMLMEVSYAKFGTFTERMQMVREIRRSVPDCKMAMICDAQAAPDIARKVMNAKQDGVIDAFFYTSVTGDYLTAVLSSMATVDNHRKE